MFHFNIGKILRAAIVQVNSLALIICTINDDSIGFDPEKKSDSFGIRSMQERANALGSAVTFESAPGKGTRISVTVAL